jgi:outer membrane protein, multidrug efflux system
MNLPSAYTLYESDNPGQGSWWERFGSDELDALVQEALTANFDIRSA